MAATYEPLQPKVPRLAIVPVSATAELTPRSARAAVERALAEQELVAASAADVAADAREAQLTARSEARAAAEAAEAASRRAATAGTELAQQEAAAAKASAAAAEVAASAASRDARETTRKAALHAGVVAASAGSYVVVSSGRTVETFDTETLAIRAVEQRWWPPWILYHEQRGCFTEIISGGIGMPFAHASIRRTVHDVMSARVNQVYGRNY